MPGVKLFFLVGVRGGRETEVRRVAAAAVVVVVVAVFLLLSKLLLLLHSNVSNIDIDSVIVMLTD